MTNVRLKSVVRNVIQKSDGEQHPFLGLEDIEGGTGRLLVEDLPVKTADDSICHRPGDVLFSKLRPYLAKSHLPTAEGTNTSELLVLRPGPEIDSRFLLHVTLSTPWVEWANTTAYGTKMPRTSWDLVGGYQTWLPPLEEQRRIADFLDAETTHIEQLSALRKRSFSLLSERAASQMDLAVRGLPAPRTKRADYTPLGEIPSNWLEARLRSIDCEVQTGPFGSQLHAEDYVEGAWPVINPANITPAGLIADPSITVPTKVRDRLARHVLREGDVIFGRRGELGRASIVQSEQEGWVCGTGSLRVRFRDNAFHSGYLRRYLTISAVRHYFRLQAIGSTMPNLNTGILLSMPLLLPDPAEQATASRRCDEIDAWSVKATSSVDRQVQLLAERRQALITAAVTGQFDVSTASGRYVTDGVRA
ncbi:restriction endonuclease subunit S [Streptomyces sp. NBC_00046]|uniref:restriction endonuclease subunit S n=1 Tax=unclassified Streptomyces TaxID=2593676 RepID=UPI003253A68D